MQAAWSFWIAKQSTGLFESSRTVLWLTLKSLLHKTLHRPAFAYESSSSCPFYLSHTECYTCPVCKSFLHLSFTAWSLCLCPVSLSGVIFHENSVLLSYETKLHFSCLFSFIICTQTPKGKIFLFYSHIDIWNKFMPWIYFNLASFSPRVILTFYSQPILWLDTVSILSHYSYSQIKWEEIRIHADRFWFRVEFKIIH